MARVLQTLLGCIAITVAAGASTALAASGVKVCVPEAEGKAIVTPKAGLCKTKYRLTELGAEGKEGKQGLQGGQGETGKEGPPGKEGPEGHFAELSEAQQKTLVALLQYVTFEEHGVGEKPTVYLSGVNFEVNNGVSDNTVNGTGNVIIGKDEHPQGLRTGSDNLILGSAQSYSSYGSLIAGFDNTSAGRDSVVLGTENYTSGQFASIVGGSKNEAGGAVSSISGGKENKAEESWSSVDGGRNNWALAIGATILGGQNHIFREEWGTIP